MGHANRWTCQSGVIAYRFEDDEPEVLLVTSTNRRRWVIPKGNIQDDLTPRESAEQEAYEEAGIRGESRSRSIGEYEYEKYGRRYRVEVFLFEVEKELSTWPEANIRKREWLSVKEAAHRVDEPKLKHLLWRAVEHLTEVAAR